MCVSRRIVSSSPRLLAFHGKSDKAILDSIASGKTSLAHLEGALNYDHPRSVRLRRLALASKMEQLGAPEAGVGLKNLPQEGFDYSNVFRRNCECVVGHVSLPVGAIGPLYIDGSPTLVPLATTEGALVASINRGAKALAACGGVSTAVLRCGMTRAPLLRFASFAEALSFAHFASSPRNVAAMAAAFDRTSRFARLQSVSVQLSGRLAFVRLSAFTADAMGMNMVTRGAQAVVDFLREGLPSLADDARSVASSPQSSVTLTSASAGSSTSSAAHRPTSPTTSTSATSTPSRSPSCAASATHAPSSPTASASAYTSHASETDRVHGTAEGGEWDYTCPPTTHSGIPAGGGPVAPCPHARADIDREGVPAPFPGAELLTLSSNTCTDKKPTGLNWTSGRGHSVVASARVPGRVLKGVLRSDARMVAEMAYGKLFLGSTLAGAVGGANAHAANTVAAIFTATGQDIAQVATSSAAMISFRAVPSERLDASQGGERGGEAASGGSGASGGGDAEDGGFDLEVDLTMPVVEVGTVGGGTMLPAQKACLEMLGVAGPTPAGQAPGTHASRLARVVAATVLAAELNLHASLAANHLLSAHLHLNRAASPSSAQ